jgi:predicted DNA-binding transcriptional regulator AlpA
VPPPCDIIPTREAVKICGYAEPSTLIRWIDKGRLPYLVKLPGKRGAYLFDRAVVEAFAAERAAERGAA